MSDPFTSSLLFLTKMLSLGAVAMISLDRELLQAIITPFLECVMKKHGPNSENISQAVLRLGTKQWCQNLVPEPLGHRDNL